MPVAPNVLYAFLGGLTATVAIHYAKLLGYDCPPDIATGLPFAFAVAIAHGMDMWSGENKK